MLVVGVLGLVVNLVALVLLRGGAGESLNVKGAYLEVVADTVGSVGVIVAALLVAATGSSVWDTVIALAIAAFVAVRAVLLGREVLAVLGQHAPAGIVPAEAETALRGVGAVVDVHDLHLWTLTSGMHVATVHLVCDDGADPTVVLTEAAGGAARAVRDRARDDPGRAAQRPGLRRDQLVTPGIRAVEGRNAHRRVGVGREVTTSAGTRVSRASVGLRSERGPVLLAVMLSTGLVAIDATILAAAVPAVVRDLGGLSQFPWLFSVYLLAQAVSVPIYGKVSDLVGRKPVMLLGVAAVPRRVAAVRAVLVDGQPDRVPGAAGPGAGAVQPVGMTIVGDIYSVAERATVQGYIAAVWAISSLVGPTLGGVFADYASWRWIFLVNLPLGALAAWMLWRKFEEQPRARDPERARPKVDVLGTVLMLVGTVALLVALLEGGILWNWASPVSIGLLVGSLLVLVAFVLVERRAAEPVLPLWVFRHRVVGRRWPPRSSSACCCSG